MKLTVLEWIKEGAIPLIGRGIELGFRLILFILPLGVYMCLLQLRSKASSITSISTYTEDNSRFQHIFPGFILVSINPDSLTSFVKKANSNFQLWVNSNKYTLSFLFMAMIVGLMVLSYIKGG